MIFVDEIGLKINISVMYNGYDSSLFYPKDLKKCRKLLNLPYDKFIILTVGNLLEVKGHKYLIEAVSEVILSRQNILCIIVGDGILKEKLDTQIKSAGLENHVKLVGGKPHGTIPLWMNASNLFVLSSLNEGNPIVMLESIGVGLPFIGTKVGAIPEIIYSEDYGLLVNPDDSKDLAKKISTAMDKKWDKRKIIDYSDNFSWDNIAEHLQKLYMSLILLS
jgi:glycosyltransferase involved in cell wall biosynthesis